MKSILQYVSCAALLCFALMVIERLPLAGVYYLKKDKASLLKALLRLNMAVLALVTTGLLLTPWVALWQYQQVVMTALDAALIGCIAWVVREGWWRAWMLLLVYGAVFVVGMVAGGIPEQYDTAYWTALLNYLPTLYLFFANYDGSRLANASQRSFLARKDVWVALIVFVIGHIVLYQSLIVAGWQLLRYIVATPALLIALAAIMSYGLWLIHRWVVVIDSGGKALQITDPTPPAPLPGRAPHELPL
ncbi:MAG: hypothetical protein WAQ25_01645 [Candidatus Saccharimonas sp.]